MQELAVVPLGTSPFLVEMAFDLRGVLLRSGLSLRLGLGFRLGLCLTLRAGLCLGRSVTFSSAPFAPPLRPS